MHAKKRLKAKNCQEIVKSCSKSSLRLGKKNQKKNYNCHFKPKHTFMYSLKLAEKKY